MEGAPVELDIPISDAISRIRFAPSSNYLLISSWDSVLRLYNAERQELKFEGPSEGALLDCCFQDDAIAFTASSDSCVRRHILSTQDQSTVYKHDDVATCVEYSKETGQIISVGLDKKLIFCDDRTSHCNKGFSVNSEVDSLSLCGLYVIAATGRTICIYDLRNLTEATQVMESQMDYQIRCVQSFSNYEGYAVGSLDGRVTLENFDTSRDPMTRLTFWCHPKSKGRKCHLASVNDIKFHPCYGNFITGDNEGYAIIWDAQSKKKLFEFPRYDNSVASLAYSRDGQLLAVAVSHTYQEANELEDAPRIFIYETECFK